MLIESAAHCRVAKLVGLYWVSPLSVSVAKSEDYTSALQHFFASYEFVNDC